MASPIAHNFAGFWSFLVLASQLKARLISQWRQYLPQLALLILLANLPDLDFLIGLGTEANANALHRGFTHSLAAAVFVALAVSCVWRIAASFWRSAILCFSAYSSHLLIDLCTGTKLGWNAAASGIPLFWPLSKTYSSPFILVFGVRHENLQQLFSIENMWSPIYELLTFGAITAIVLAVRARIG